MGVTRILQGNCIDTLKTLDACSVQTCVTSPPYYGLRDYGTARWIGGSEDCDHKQTVARHDGGRVNVNGFHGSNALDSNKGEMNYRKVCGKCGALRIDDQIGLEETPEAYVQKLVEVFRQVRRVLKDDGTVWLNLGDSYASATKGSGGPSPKQESNKGSWYESRKFNHGVKEKDLLGIPWMVAFALRADGWYLRSDIIWHKPNPMPESVTDRPTKSHEYIFLLSKSAQYYYDAEAIKEPANDADWQSRYDRVQEGNKSLPNEKKNGIRARTPKNLQPDGQQPNSMHLRRADGLPDTEYPARNKRSVWTVSTKPYSGAHFATFPPDLIEPCILAGSKPDDWVLDPFGGSGTTLAVAIKHHRNGIACELNPSYIELMNKRLNNVQPVLFATVHP